MENIGITSGLLDMRLWMNMEFFDISVARHIYIALPSEDIAEGMCGTLDRTMCVWHT